MKRIDTYSHTYHEKLMTKMHLYIFLIIQKMFTRRVKASPKEFAFSPHANPWSKTGSLWNALDDLWPSVSSTSTVTP